MQNQHITIDNLVSSDIQFLKKILKQHVRDSQSGSILRSEITDIVNFMRGKKDQYNRIRHYLVARHKNSNILGCMAYSEPEPKMLKHFSTNKNISSELLNAFVSKKFYKGKGIGRKLVNNICQKIKKLNKKQLLVNSGPRYKESWGFYDKIFDRSCGYIKDRYGPGGHAKTWIKIIE